jgi:hypothetical protein
MVQSLILGFATELPRDRDGDGACYMLQLHVANKNKKKKQEGASQATARKDNFQLETGGEGILFTNR